MKPTPEDRLMVVFDRLHATLLNDDGGPVMHEATVDGWTLRLSQSDFGEIFFTASKESRGKRVVHGWERYELWHPYSVDTPSMEPYVAMAERAEWKDLLEGKRGRGGSEIGR